MRTLNALINGNELSNVYIAGAGQYGEMIFKYLTKHNIAVAGVVDRDRKVFNDARTLSYDEIDVTAKYIVASLNYEYGKEISKTLIDKGVSRESIYTIDDEQVIINLFDVTYDYSKNLSSRIEAFKNKYKGETCFIIGNGPSLRVEDLNKLVGKHCFAANGIYNLYESTNWRPEFYFAQDSYMVRDFLYDEYERIISDSYIFTSINSKMIDYADKTDRIGYMRLYYQEDKRGLPCFSSKCETIIYLSRTVSYSMLQMAAYMGFSTIYLLGMDCQYKYELQENGSVITNNVAQHNAQIDELFFSSNKDMDKEWKKEPSEVFQHIRGYCSAREYGKQNGIKIYNATRGGKLEIFERKQFDTIFDN